jgi:thiol-disulfide isomerase/thioredoxin
MLVNRMSARNRKRVWALTALEGLLVFIGAAPLSAGPKEDFNLLQTEMENAEEQFIKALEAFENRSDDKKGFDAAPPQDGRKPILRRMDDLVDASAGKGEQADIAFQTLQWAVHIEPGGALRRFEKLARQFPELPELADFVPNIPDLINKSEDIPGWLQMLDQLRKTTTQKDTQTSCWFATGQIQLDAGRMDPAKLAFEQVKKTASARELTEAAKAFLFEIERLQPGMEAPDFATKALDGSEVTLKSLRGKVVLLNFWATWCAPCVGEIPHLQSIVSRLAGKPFEILWVSVDDEREAVEGLLRIRKAPGIQTWDSKGQDNPVAGLYNVRRLPTWYLIDRNGAIKVRDPDPEKLQAMIESLAGGESDSARSPGSAEPNRPPSTP